MRCLEREALLVMLVAALALSLPTRLWAARAPILQSDDGAPVVAAAKAAAADSDDARDAGLRWSKRLVRDRFSKEAHSESGPAGRVAATKRIGPAAVELHARDEARRDSALAAHSMNNIIFRDVIRDEMAGSGIDPQTHGSGAARVRAP